MNIQPETKPFARSGTKPGYRKYENTATIALYRIFAKNDTTIVFDNNHSFAYGTLTTVGNIIAGGGSHYMWKDRTNDEYHEESDTRRRRELESIGAVRETEDPLLGEFVSDTEVGSLSGTTVIINTMCNPNGWIAWATQDGKTLAEHRLDIYNEVFEIINSGIINSKVCKGIDNMELVIREVVRRFS